MSLVRTYLPAFAVVLAIGFSSATSWSQMVPENCTGEVLVEDATCTTLRLCIIASNPNCLNAIYKNDEIDMCFGAEAGAVPGDHCKSTTSLVDCAKKVECDKVGDECQSGNTAYGYVKKNSGWDAGTCVLPPNGTPVVE